MDALLKYLNKATDITETDFSNKDVGFVNVFVSTNVGFVREHNEDNYFVICTSEIKTNDLIGKLKTASLTQITDFISTVGPLVTTNFKTSEISRLGTSAIEYLNYPITEFRLPTDDNVRNETYDKKMVLVINDIAKAKKDLLNFIYEDEEMAQKEASKVKIQPTENYSTKQNNAAAPIASAIPQEKKSAATPPSAADSNRSYQSEKSKQTTKPSAESSVRSSQSSSTGENPKSSSGTTSNNSTSSSKSTSNTESSAKSLNPAQKSSSAPK